MRPEFRVKFTLSFFKNQVIYIHLTQYFPKIYSLA